MGGDGRALADRGPWWRLLFVLAALALVVGACGGDDGESADGGGDGSEEAGDGGGGEDGGSDGDGDLPAECQEPPYELEWRLEGDGPREPVEIADAVAIKGFDGGAWTLILSDAELPRDYAYAELSGYPDMPADALLMQAGIFVQMDEQENVEPVEVGETVADVESEVHTVGWNIAQGAQQSSSVNIDERATLLHAGDDFVCIEFDITSESGNELVGVAAAEIVAEG